MDEKGRKEYINSELRFFNKTVHLLLKLFSNSKKKYH